jgi:hypothetical protein
VTTRNRSDARQFAEPQYEVFLSHATRDRAFATKLARLLRRHGLRVWYSRTEIVGAQQWHDEIGTALRQCRWLVVVLSRASVGSRWVKQELLYALNDRRYKNRIVPILYEPCAWASLSWTLKAIQIVDFRNGFKAGSRDLRRVWDVASRRTVRRSTKGRLSRQRSRR